MCNMALLFLIFWGTFILFSIVAAPIYILTNSKWGFPYLYFSVNLCYLLFVSQILLPNHVNTAVIKLSSHYPIWRCHLFPARTMMDPPCISGGAGPSALEPHWSIWDGGGAVPKGKGVAISRAKVKRCWTIGCKGQRVKSRPTLLRQSLMEWYWYMNWCFWSMRR